MPFSDGNALVARKQAIKIFEFAAFGLWKEHENDGHPGCLQVEAISLLPCLTLENEIEHLHSGQRR